jgi:hypothetical protein
MPYINKGIRDAMASEERPTAATAGELNYLFTLLAIEYIKANGLNYQRLNDVVGALDGAKAEFQRRVVAPYEDTKIRENGDVYPPELLGV